jgi:hypothetical protein
MSQTPFPIISIDPIEVVGEEQLGSKEKFWFRRAGQLWLFKEARVIHADGAVLPAGEDWAEKIASEVAQLLNIPVATVELAEYQGRRGCASLNFTTQAKQLEHGNEVMAGLLDGYDPELRYRQTSHTVDNIVTAVSKMFPSLREHRSALQQLASYLVLDALIGNTDRHHENWGFLWQVQVDIDEVTEAGRITKEYEVAPTFDLGSSLGRELLDAKRLQHLANKTVENYLRKARGGIFMPGAKRGASPLALVESTAQEYPDYFRPTLDRLRSTPLERIVAIVDRVPGERMTPAARDFAKAMLGVAHECLRRVV